MRERKMPRPRWRWLLFCISLDIFWRTRPGTLVHRAAAWVLAGCEVWRCGEAEEVADG